MQISREKKLEMLQSLLLSRRFEESLTELDARGTLLG
jgi:TPP-dependent pyruvate/acetoin dehydrogenase alpha subunit